MLNLHNLVVYLGHYPVICLGGLKKTNKTLSSIDTAWLQNRSANHSTPWHF